MRQIKFELQALEELEDWIRTQPKTAAKIVDLLQEISKTPFEGKGKPEPSKINSRDFGREELQRNTV